MIYILSHNCTKQRCLIRKALQIKDKYLLGRCSSDVDEGKKIEGGMWRMMGKLGFLY